MIAQICFDFKTVTNRNSRAARMNTGRRWKDVGTSVPGPGTYEEIGCVAAGDQVVSTFHTTLTKNLATTETRHKWGGNPRFRTPGPGTYRPPSDFGYLDFKNTLRENINLNGTMGMMTGFNSSFADPKDALALNKFDSIHSAKKSNRRNVS